jgi:ABC-type transport system substrate-binding protein
MVVSEAGSGGRNPGYENFSMFLGWPSWHTGASVVMNDPGIMFNVLTGFYEGWTVDSWKYNSTFDELTMKLKEDVKWSDGKPMNADDWVFMFNYLRDAAGKVGELAQIDVLKENGASKIDDWTVKFELEDPSPIWWNTTISSNHVRTSGATRTLPNSATMTPTRAGRWVRVRSLSHRRPPSRLSTIVGIAGGPLTLVLSLSPR